MKYILDCSFCASLFLPDEKSESIKNSFLNIEENDEVYIPLLWWYEMSNVLTTAIKRKRLKHNDVLNINKLLSSFNFITDLDYGSEYTEKLLELTQIYNLSAYDAAYLELGIRKQGSIGTLDKELTAACIKAGLNTL